MKSSAKFILLVSCCLMINTISAEDLEPIDDFIQKIYFEGFPYQKAIKYDESNSEKLVNMLSDIRYLEYWSSIVLTLESIGSADVFPDIVHFIEAEYADDDISHHHQKAVEAAVYGLGYLIHRTGSKDAIEYLSNGLKPKQWLSVGARNFSSSEDNDKRANKLARKALFGLALAGRPETEAKLIEIKKSTSLYRDATKAYFGPQLDTAISESKKIRKVGLDNYNN